MVILHSPIIVMSFHRTRRFQILFSSLTTWYAISKIREYFAVGRHADVDCFYLYQTYAKILKHLIHDNTNLLILFKQDGTNLKHVYNDHVNINMSYEDFYELCRYYWQQKYGFVVINKDSALTNGRYKKEFNEHAIP